MGRRQCLEVKIFTVPLFPFGGRGKLFCDVIIEKAEAKKRKVLGSSSSADKTGRCSDSRGALPTYP